MISRRFPAWLLPATFLLTSVMLAAIVACRPPGAASTHDSGSEDTEAVRQDKPRVIVQRRRPKRRPPKRLRSYPGNDSDQPDSLPDLKTTWLNQPPASSGYSAPGLGETQVWERLQLEIQDAVSIAPTEVVFLVDVSPSARQWHSGFIQLLSDYYATLSTKHPEVAAKLTTRVGTFTKMLTWVTPQATADAAAVAKLWRELPESDDSVENTFAAVQQTIPLLRTARLKERKEVVLVILTDEAGDDGALLLGVLTDLQKYSIPVHVIGVPAPFGRRTVTSQKSEGGIDGVPPPGEPAVIIQGPETQQVERIHLVFPDGRTTHDDIDSGFGPYALELLARESGGRFWGVFDNSSSVGDGSSWPSAGAVRFDPAVMKRYRPKLESPDHYQAFVDSHACCQVLLQAAKLGPIPVLTDVTTSFAKGDPAKLKRDVDTAQQAAAKVELEINRAYDLLKQGLASRQSLTDPRWSASYDLAFGRIAAAKARVDGYNGMLAALKRGLPEKNKDATLWTLVPAETTDITSTLRSLVNQAREHLERVIKEHPGTPWEFLAKEELRAPLGWKWEEH